MCFCVLCRVRACFVWAAQMFHNPSFICDWYDFALMDLVSFYTPVYEFHVVFSHSLNDHKALVAFCLFIPPFFCFLVCFFSSASCSNISCYKATHLKQIKGGNRILLSHCRLEPNRTKLKRTEQNGIWNENETTLNKKTMDVTYGNTFAKVKRWRLFSASLFLLFLFAPSV